jgi:hypothetical protein
MKKQLGLLLLLVPSFAISSTAKAEKINLFGKINSIDCKVVFDEEPGIYKLRFATISTPTGPLKTLATYLTYPTLIGSKTRTYKVKSVQYDTTSATYEITNVREDGVEVFANIFAASSKGQLGRLELYKCQIVGNWK